MNNNIDKELLISAVRKRPILWDFCKNNYHKRNKHGEWVEVAREVTQRSDPNTVSSIKATWTSLMTIYRRIIKNHNAVPSGSGGDTEVRWRFFSAMEFLRKNYNDRQAYTYKNIYEQSLNEFTN